ncbi:toxin-antitoxin system HicB family antitoxin [Marinomonas sp. A3A]|jgi:predicted HicB family RNase H-like nuclease|uniref:type II toxin-antitoxin system HicB family antitoxin n=1 Tax=Marinomonas sp. A3A TaxID=2065312 RepID=UPI001BB40679|nr:type II toxin-antitoxin system HicB family antitoxin [Marinomonas sp. A3A]QUX92088.1 toxin-antitoxin system HicB family antitoxin [Marinomonas sp. A3A]
MTYLRYKDYLGTIEPELESNTLFGKLAFIRDTVTYEAMTLKQLEVEFRRSVNEYLLSCEELGREAQKPCKGSFNIRTGEALHREAVVAAEGQSLNAFVCDAIREKIAKMNHHGLG